MWPRPFLCRKERKAPLYCAIVTSLRLVSVYSGLLDKQATHLALRHNKATEYVTHYEKRDCSGFFAELAFLVWIVSSASVECNGANLKEFYSEAEL